MELKNNENHSQKTMIQPPLLPVNPGLAHAVVRWQHHIKPDLRLRIGIFAIAIVGTVAVINTFGQARSFSNELNTSEATEILARTQYMQSIFAVRQDPEKAGAVVQATLNDAGDARNFLIGEMRLPGSRCYGKTLDACADIYVNRFLTVGINEAVESPDRRLPVLLTRQERIALVFLKVTRLDAARYQKIAKSKLPVNVVRVRSTHQALSDVRSEGGTE